MSDPVQPTESTLPAELTPLTDFTLLPKLPIEVRLKIWNSALPGPRFVEITSQFRDDDDRADDYDTYWKPQTADPRLSNISHACHEARVEVLRRYTKTMHSHEPGSQVVRFDPKVDVIAMTAGRVTLEDQELAVQWYLNEIMDQIGPIQSLAIDVTWVRALRDFPRLLMGLKDLMLVDQGQDNIIPEWRCPTEEGMKAIGGFREDEMVHREPYYSTYMEVVSEVFGQVSESDSEWVEPDVRGGRWIMDDSFKIDNH